MAGAAGDDLLAKRDKGGDNFAQGQEFGAAAVQRQHVDAEARLQRGMAVELVEDNVRFGVTLQFDHDAHTFAVALVAHFGNTVDELFADGLGDALDQFGFVYLIRNLGKDDGLTVLADLLDVRFGAQDYGAPTCLVGGVRTGPSHDDSA